MTVTTPGTTQLILLLTLVGVGIVWVVNSLRLRKENVRTILFRTLALLSLSIGLLSPGIAIERPARAPVVLVDISESMVAEDVGLLLSKARSLVPDSSALSFSDSASAPFLIDEFSSLAGARRFASGLSFAETNLEVGLERAVALSQGAGVVLITDGYQTRGDVRRFVDSERGKSVPIFPLLPDTTSLEREEFRIVELQAPISLPEKRKAAVRVVLKNTLSRDGTGKLRVYQDGEVVSDESVTVQAGTEKLFTVEGRPVAEGVREIRAEFIPNDSLPPSERKLFITGEAGEKVLLVSGSREDADLLDQVLKGQGYQLESVYRPEDIKKLEPLERFSVVVFNNVSRDSLAGRAPDDVKRYVYQGGRFLMIGGNKSFGLGGYRGTAIEDVLPVQLLPPQTELKSVSLAVQLVLDKSRSMSYDNKLEYAKEAAREVIRNLKDEDYAGIIGFDAAPFIAVRVGQMREIRAVALDRIGRIIPAGNTNMLPALDEARRGLMRVPAGRKHMIVLTDGKIPDEGPIYLELVRQLRDLGITVSTVLLGGEFDTGMLRDMAKLGGGSFYLTQSARDLPRIFLQDVRVATGERTMRELSQYLVRLGPGKLNSTSIRSFPPVRGYVQTREKPGANLELVVNNNQRIEPLLATERFGEGIGVAFTSDANGRWSLPWARWPNFTTFWGELIDSLRRGRESGERIPFDFGWRVVGGDLKLELTVYKPLADESVLFRVKAEGREEELSGQREAPGRYSATLPSVRAGRHDVEIALAGSALPPLALDVPAELVSETARGFHVAILEELARRSGGTVNPSAAQLKSGGTKVETMDLTHWFIALALIALILEIGSRELGWLRFISRRVA